MTAEAISLTAALAVFAAALLRLATVRPLWFDEVFTLNLSKPATLPDLWGHLAAGVDLNPPVTYLLTAASLACFGESEWALRLPAVSGGVLAAGCLYLFGRFRGGPAGGCVVATAGLLNRDIGAPYFYEARPYGLMIGFAAAALLGWQRATAADGTPRRGWLALLAAGGILGVATHYFFVLVVAGLVFGEAVRSLMKRRIDWPVVGCFAAGGAVLLALMPLWRGPSREYAGGFWARPRLDAFDAWELYEGLTAPAVLAVVGAAAGVAVVARLLTRRVAAEPLRTPVWELAVLAAWTAGPVSAMVLGATVTGVYHARYTVPLLIGPGVLIGLALARLAGPARWGAVAAAGVFVAGMASQWRSEYRELVAKRDSVERTVAELRDRAGGRRVVVESSGEFAQVWYYGAPTGVRPVYVVDFDRVKKYRLSDTVEVGLSRLTRVTPVPLSTLAELETAIDGGEDVLLFLHGNSWLSRELQADGFRWYPVGNPAPDSGTFTAQLCRLTRGR